MNNETKPIEWAILIATIMGTIVQPLITYYLDNRRNERLKRLENQQEQDAKRIKSTEESLNDYRGIAINLEKIATNNSNLLAELHETNKKLIEKNKEILNKAEEFSTKTQKVFESTEIRDKKLKEKLCPTCLKEFKKKLIQGK